jgi:hypothetical protein
MPSTLQDVKILLRDESVVIELVKLHCDNYMKERPGI